MGKNSRVSPSCHSHDVDMSRRVTGVESTPAQRLNAALDAQRKIEGKTWTQVVEEAGISMKTMDRIRRVDGYKRLPETSAAIEGSLNLPRGYLDAVEADENPDPTGDGDELSRLRARVARMAHDMADVLAQIDRIIDER